MQSKHLGRIARDNGINVAESSDFFTIRINNQGIGKDQSQLRVAIESGNLFGESVGQHYVVTIHETNVFALCQA